MMFTVVISRLKMAFHSRAPKPSKMKISLKENFIASNFPFRGLFCVSHTSLQTEALKNGCQFTLHRSLEINTLQKSLELSDCYDLVIGLHLAVGLMIRPKVTKIIPDSAPNRPPKYRTLPCYVWYFFPCQTSGWQTWQSYIALVISPFCFW